jgi:hypothetical protein
MKTTIAKYVVAAGLIAGSAVSLPEGAYAMPSLDPGVSTAATAAAPQIEQARWVCGPYRCGWRPNYWGPRPGWGWRRGWRRW